MNPSAGSGGGKRTDGADDSFRDTKEHGVAGIANGDDGFPLMSRGRGGERKRGKIPTFDFQQSDIQIGIEKNNFCVELRAARHFGEKSAFAAGDVRVRGD